MSLRTPMGRVLGLGSAKEGAGHWWSQRVSAAALVLLTLWFVVALLRLDGFEYETLAAWAAAPVNAALLLLLTVVLVYHSMLGVQVVVEDYVHGAAKIVTLVFSTFVHVALGALGALAVLRIAFGGAA
ncbi:MAG: succinate dehydrogenase, hydrophobic membrane anchor protein [Steroidobacteraceae bacterium]|nr:succinate dehydrogenase, hydrophobic membrane anchor protein [Steroidobacteraceae bacterium]